MRIIIMLLRTADLLLSFSLETPSLSPNQLSKISKIPLSSIYRYLNPLLAKGFISRNVTDKTYRLGPALINLGRIALAGFNVRTLVIPWMQKLQKSTGQTIYFIIRKDISWICLESIMPNDHGIAYVLRSGEIGPIYAGCGGKILFAYLAEEERDQLIKKLKMVKITPETITDPKKLVQVLKEIRALGYHYSESEYINGAWGLGAPVLNCKGEAEGAIVISGVIVREKRVKVTEMAKLLCQTTQAISREMGYLGEAPQITYPGIARTKKLRFSKNDENPC